jgi:glycosyltransferase involved in cell wall biosynthesis
MVDPSTKPSAKMLDILATRRLLRAASAVLSLTAQEDSDLRQVEPASRVSRLGNGVSIGELPDWSERERVVLFLARLHPRKRPVAFVEMAALLRDRLPGYTFLVAGPDEGEAPAVSKRIDELRLADVVKCIGPVPPDQTGDLLRSVSALVLPSVGEVFPMTLLESMRAGTPIVATESLGIADECVRYGAASITDGSPTALAEAVLDIVLPERAHLRRAGAERYLRENLDIAEVVNELEDVYARATSEARMNSSERGFH